MADPQKGIFEGLEPIQTGQGPVAPKKPATLKSLVEQGKLAPMKPIAGAAEMDALTKKADEAVANESWWSRAGRVAERAFGGILGGAVGILEEVGDYATEIPSSLKELGEDVGTNVARQISPQSNLAKRKTTFEQYNEFMSKVRKGEPMTQPKGEERKLAGTVGMVQSMFGPDAPHGYFDEQEKKLKATPVYEAAKRDALNLGEGLVQVAGVLTGLAPELAYEEAKAEQRAKGQIPQEFMTGMMVGERAGRSVVGGVVIPGIVLTEGFRGEEGRQLFREAPITYTLNALPILKGFARTARLGRLTKAQSAAVEGALAKTKNPRTGVPFQSLEEMTGYLEDVDKRVKGGEPPITAEEPSTVGKTGQVVPDQPAILEQVGGGVENILKQAGKAVASSKAGLVEKGLTGTAEAARVAPWVGAGYSLGGVPGAILGGTAALAFNPLVRKFVGETLGPKVGVARKVARVAGKVQRGLAEPRAYTSPETAEVGEQMLTTAGEGRVVATKAEAITKAIARDGVAEYDQPQPLVAEPTPEIETLQTQIADINDKISKGQIRPTNIEEDIAAIKSLKDQRDSLETQLAEKKRIAQMRATVADVGEKRGTRTFEKEETTGRVGAEGVAFNEPIEPLVKGERVLRVNPNNPQNVGKFNELKGQLKGTAFDNENAATTLFSEMVRSGREGAELVGLIDPEIRKLVIQRLQKESGFKFDARAVEAFDKRLAELGQRFRDKPIVGNITITDAFEGAVGQPGAGNPFGNLQSYYLNNYVLEANKQRGFDVRKTLFNNAISKGETGLKGAAQAVGQKEEVFFGEKSKLKTLSKEEIQDKVNREFEEIQKRVDAEPDPDKKAEAQLLVDRGKEQLAASFEKANEDTRQQLSQNIPQREQLFENWSSNRAFPQSLETPPNEALKLIEQEIVSPVKQLTGQDRQSYLNYLKRLEEHIRGFKQDSKTKLYVPVELAELPQETTFKPAEVVADQSKINQFVNNTIGLIKRSTTTYNPPVAIGNYLGNALVNSMTTGRDPITGLAEMGKASYEWAQRVKAVVENRQNLSLTDELTLRAVPRENAQQLVESGGTFDWEKKQPVKTLADAYGQGDLVPKTAEALKVSETVVGRLDKLPNNGVIIARVSPTEIISIQRTGEKTFAIINPTTGNILTTGTLESSAVKRYLGAVVKAGVDAKYPDVSQVPNWLKITMSSKNPIGNVMSLAWQMPFLSYAIKAADNPFRNGIGGTVLMLDQSPILFDSGAGTGVRPALGNLLDNQGFLKNYLMSRGLLNSLNNRLDNLSAQDADQLRRLYAFAPDQIKPVIIGELFKMSDGSVARSVSTPSYAQFWSMTDNYARALGGVVNLTKRLKGDYDLKSMEKNELDKYFMDIANGNRPTFKDAMASYGIGVGLAYDGYEKLVKGQEEKLGLRDITKYFGAIGRGIDFVAQQAGWADPKTGTLKAEKSKELRDSLVPGLAGVFLGSMYENVILPDAEVIKLVNGIYEESWKKFIQPQIAKAEQLRKDGNDDEADDLEDELIDINDKLKATLEQKTVSYISVLKKVGIKTDLDEQDKRFKWKQVKIREAEDLPPTVINKQEPPLTTPEQDKAYEMKPVQPNFPIYTPPPEGED